MHAQLYQSFTFSKITDIFSSVMWSHQKKKGRNEINKTAFFCDVAADQFICSFVSDLKY